MRRLVRFCLFGPLGLVLLLSAIRAEAHALLLSFQQHGPLAELHYNGRVDAARSRLTLLDQDGTHPRKLDCAAGDDLATLKTTLADVPPGGYILHWEVLSVDGHLSRGDQRLTLPAP